MRAYSRAWSTLAGSLLLGTCAAAGATGPVSFYAALFVMGTAAAAALGALSPASDPQASGLLGLSIIAGAVLVAAAALLGLSAWLLAAVAMTFALTCPGVVRLVLTRSSRDDGQSPTPHPSPPAPDVRQLPAEGLRHQVDAVFLECLDTVELCRAWRQSFVWLQLATTDEHRAHIVDHRERCLDELCRRDPDGVTQWLEHGPRAASGPEKYLRRYTRRVPPT